MLNTAISPMMKKHKAAAADRFSGRRPIPATLGSALSDAASTGAVASSHQTTMRADPQASGRRQSAKQTSRVLGRLVDRANPSNRSTSDAAQNLPINMSNPGGSHSSMRRAAAADDVVLTYSYTCQP